MSKTLLVIPSYRDSLRLRPFLDDLLSVLPSRFSILVSDDGSGEKDVSDLLKLIQSKQQESHQKSPVLQEVLLHSVNTGKGAAVKRGWKEVDERSLFAFADADGAVNASEILRAENYMRQNWRYADAVFGSRIKMLGRSIYRTPLRHVIGRVFATLVSFLSGVGAYDTQCGLKIIKSTAFKKIQPFMKCQGFAFDVELCMLLLKTRHSVVEFPVDWRDVAGSKINLVRDSIKMGLEVFKIRRRVNSLRF